MTMKLSLAEIPITEETREAIRALGIPDIEIPHSELGGQSILALHIEAPEDIRPKCYSSKFDPLAAKCLGCVFLPTCWQKDHGYLRRLKAGKAPPPPEEIPPSEVEAAMSRAVSLPVPPRPPSVRKLRPPPPPRRPH